MSRSMPWCKLYAEARLDKKLSHLTLAERGVWVNLLCYAGEAQEDRGSFNASDRFALALECADGDEATLNSTIEKLVRVRHLITLESRDGWLRFRTFEERQARKPSDEPEATRDRQQRSRASRRGNALSHPVTRDIGKNGDVTRLDRRRENREIRDDPPFSLSGEDSYISTDDAERARDIEEASSSASTPASAAATSSNHHQEAWTELEARRVGKRIVAMLKLPPSAVDGMVIILQQYPYTPTYLEYEAVKCAEWYAEKKRRTSLRIFGNWLQEGVQRKAQAEEEQRQQQLAKLNGNHSSSNGKESYSNGTTQQVTLDPTKDPEHLKRYARLVQQRGQRQVTG